MRKSDYFNSIFNSTFNSFNMLILIYIQFIQNHLLAVARVMLLASIGRLSIFAA